MSNTKILVTGGSGFLASRCILDALKRGYAVRTTVRTKRRADDVKTMLSRGGATEAQIESVEFSTADLLDDDGWADACRGCTYVLHVASPFPPTKPKHEDDLIIPARDGTLPATYGHSDRGDRPYDEGDWTILDNPDRPVGAYQKSKTLAEQVAWEFVRREGGDMELAVVMPGGIFGPTLSSEYGTTVRLVDRMMQGKVPGLPQLWVSCVDVRDAADLHFRAMLGPEAKGERFLCLSPDGLLSMKEVADSLKRRMGSKGQKIPSRVIPNMLLRLVSIWDEEVAMIVPELGKRKAASSEKAQRILGWQPRSAEDSVAASAESIASFAETA